MMSKVLEPLVEAMAVRPRAKLLAAGLGLLVGVRALRRVFMSRFRKVPGWPFIGVLPAMDGGKKLVACMERWADEFGKEGVYEMPLLGQRWVVVCDWDLAKHIYAQRPFKITRGTALRRLVSMFGDGLFTAEGAKWKHHRKITSPAFNSTAIRGYFPFIRETVGHLIEAIEDDVADGSRPTNFSKLLPLVAAETVVRVTFAQDFGATHSGRSVVTDNLFAVFKSAQDRLMAPLPYWHIPGASFVGLGAPGADAAAQLKADIRRLMAGIPKGDTRTLLARMTQAEGSNFSLSEVEGNLAQFLLAGTETTSSTVAWALHHLSLQPELQHKIAMEIAEKAPNAIDNKDQLAGLHLVRAVWLETLRLRSPAPYVILSSAEPLEIAGRIVPSGTMIVMLNRYMMGHAAEARALGGDLGEFRPERWLRADGGLVEFAPLDTIAFGHGVRKCPGQGLAEVEGWLALAEVLRRFHLEKGADSLGEITAFTQNPAEDVVLRLSRRSLACSP